ncbi:MAG: hypothetical protein ACJ71J_01550 [Nitrososphaeraceae archaeon]
MHETTFQSKRPLLRIGSITFLTGLAIFIISSAFHTSREDPTKHLRVFAEYANSPPWIAAHIGQFVGDITIFAGGFVPILLLTSADFNQSSFIIQVYNVVYNPTLHLHREVGFPYILLKSF